MTTSPTGRSFSHPASSLVTGQPADGLLLAQVLVLVQLFTSPCSRASTEPLLSAVTCGWGSFPSKRRLGGGHRECHVVCHVGWILFPKPFPLHSLFPGFTSVSSLFGLDCQRCLPDSVLFHSSYFCHHDLSKD